MRSYTHCFYMVVMFLSLFSCSTCVICATLLCMFFVRLFVFVSSSVECTNVCRIFFRSFSWTANMSLTILCQRDEEKKNNIYIQLVLDAIKITTIRLHVMFHCLFVPLSFGFVVRIFPSLFIVSLILLHISFGYKDISFTLSIYVFGSSKNLQNICSNINRAFIELGKVSFSFFCCDCFVFSFFFRLIII